MEKKTSLYLFLAFLLIGGISWATFTPSNISNQPNSSVASVLYAFDSVAGVWKVVNVDTNGNILTTNGASTSTPTITPTPGPTDVLLYANPSDLRRPYSALGAFTTNPLLFGTSTYDEATAGNALFKNATGIYVSTGSLANGDYIGIDASSGCVVSDKNKGMLFTTLTSGNIIFTSAGDVEINSLLNMESNGISWVADPTTANMAATKNYVDTHAGNILSGFVTFSNALTTPVTVAITGATSTSKVVFGERGAAVASSFGYTPSTNQVIFNGTAAGAATVAYMLIP